MNLIYNRHKCLNEKVLVVLKIYFCSLLVKVADTGRLTEIGSDPPEKKLDPDPTLKNTLSQYSMIDIFELSRSI